MNTVETFTELWRIIRVKTFSIPFAATRRAPLHTATVARAVPARSTSLGRGGLGNSGVFAPDKPLRTGTVRGPAVAVSRCAPIRVSRSVHSPRRLATIYSLVLSIATLIPLSGRAQVALTNGVPTRVALAVTSFNSLRPRAVLSCQPVKTAAH